MRVAIVGLGTIGRVHAAALAKAGQEVVALCDIRPERAEAIRQKHGFSATVWGDFDAMLRESGAEAVHICTPHHCHADQVIAALERGVHVLCEKPLCIREEDIGRIRAAVRASRVTLGVCHQNRYTDVNMYLHDYLADKHVVGAHGSVTWHRDAAYYGQDAWRGKKATEGGGVMINQALHTLDLMAHFLGAPSRVSARVENFTLREVTEVEDTAMAVFSGGADFTFFATLAAGSDMPVTMQFKLDNGEKITAQPNALIINGKAVEFKEKLPTVGKECYGSGHERLIADFYRSVAAGEHFPVDVEAGAFAVRMILAMYKSCGQEVTI